jgi:PAS domain S-box-containing protein
MESVLDVVSHGVIVLDTDEKVVRWSRWLARVSGIDAAAAQGRRLSEIFPELAGGRVPGAVHSALQQGFPSVISQSLNKAPFPLFAKTSPRGEAQRLQQKINVLPLKQQGAVTGCVIEIVDVSLAVHRENVLSEQKEFLNAILESAPECVMVLASDGRVLQINRAGLAMLEVPSLDAVLETGFVNFVLPTHRTQFEGMSAAVFAGADQQLEFEIQGRYGKSCWIESNAAPLRVAENATPALLLVGRDVTERRQAEATTWALINATRDAAMLLDRDSSILAVN